MIELTNQIAVYQVNKTLIHFLIKLLHFPVFLPGIEEYVNYFYLAIPTLLLIHCLCFPTYFDFHSNACIGLYRRG